MVLWRITIVLSNVHPNPTTAILQNEERPEPVEQDISFMFTGTDLISQRFKQICHATKSCVFKQKCMHTCTKFKSQKEKKTQKNMYLSADVTAKMSNATYIILFCHLLSTQIRACACMLST